MRNHFTNGACSRYEEKLEKAMKRLKEIDPDFPADDGEPQQLTEKE